MHEFATSQSIPKRRSRHFDLALGTPSDNSYLESPHNDETSNPATFPKKPELPFSASGKGKFDKQCAVQDGGINAKVVPIARTFSGSCLQFPGDLQRQPTLTIEAAVNLLLHGTHASYRMPYSWGYIDRPADGAVYLIFVGPQMSFPDDGVRFQGDEHCTFSIPVGNGRHVEVMETRFGFIPGTGDIIANRIRRKFRLIKGGNPQLVVAHYSRGRPMVVNLNLNWPTRMYPLPPIGLHPVYIAGDKAGQTVVLSGTSNPPVWGARGGMPSAIFPGDIPAGGTSDAAQTEPAVVVMNESPPLMHPRPIVGGAPPEHFLNTNDAVSYFNAVKVQFKHKPDVYNLFLNIMKDFRGQLIDTPGVIQRVAHLFHNHPLFISEFKTFLPYGYQITVMQDPKVRNAHCVGVATPGGNVTYTTIVRPPSVPRIEDIQPALGYVQKIETPRGSLGKRRSPAISNEGGTLLPDRRKEPLELRPLQPSKKRKIATDQPSIPKPLLQKSIPSQLETRQPSMYHGMVPGDGFSAHTTQEGVDSLGKAQSRGKGGVPNSYRKFSKDRARVSLQQQTKRLPPTHLSPRYLTTPTPLIPPRLTATFHGAPPPGLGHLSGGLESGKLVGAEDPWTRGSSTLVGSNEPAWKRLINNAFLPNEVIPLVKDVFTSKDQVKSICGLSGDDAQNFINVIHEALDLPDLLPRLREKCLAALCRICGRQGLLPRTLRVSVHYDQSEVPLYHGGFADVWKGEYRGSHVAVKVLRTYSTTDLGKITNRFCKEVVTWNSLCHPNVLSLWGVIMDKGRCAMVSEWMANGNINEFVKEDWEVNRFELLRDVTEGLIYIHGQGMIHGDLKGANILIGQNRRAKLADFGLLTIVSEPTYFTPSTSTARGGTTRWMSPELLHPELFGFDHSSPTKESDCYALGMVVYEVLSGRAPFAAWKDYIVIRKVIEGGRPERPEGAIRAWFTADLWRMLNMCWTTQARSRPSIKTVLECLEQISGAWEPLPPQVDNGVEEGEGDWDLSVLRV